MGLADPGFSHAGVGRYGKTFICVRPMHSLHLGVVTQLGQEKFDEIAEVECENRIAPLTIGAPLELFYLCPLLDATSRSVF